MMRATLAALALGSLLTSACAAVDAAEDSAVEDRAAEDRAAEDRAAEDSRAEDSAAGAIPAEARTDSSAEQLIGQPPAGWRRIGTTNIGTLRRAEYIPEDESEDAWDRRITFESMQEDPLPDPIEFVELMNSDRDYACGTFRAYPTFSGLENGYPTSVYFLVCHRDRVTERSEVSMIKTIQGNEHFYVITRARRGAPIPREEAPAMDEAEVGGWAMFMRSITLCDPSRADTHPCPETDADADADAG